MGMKNWIAAGVHIFTRFMQPKLTSRAYIAKMGRNIATCTGNSDISIYMQCSISGINRAFCFHYLLTLSLRTTAIVALVSLISPRTHIPFKIRFVWFRTLELVQRPMWRQIWVWIKLKRGRNIHEPCNICSEGWRRRRCRCRNLLHIHLLWSQFFLSLELFIKVIWLFQGN